MKKRLQEVINKSRLGKIIFLATLGASFYWIIFRFVPIYKIAIVGVVYELLWLPALFILFVLPLISFLFWAGEKFRISSIHLWSLSLALAVIVLGYLLSKNGMGF